MADKSVKLLIDPQDLAVIKGAQNRITLGKAVSGSAANVIWLAIDPFVSTDVSWSEEYGVYATTAQITNGAAIVKLTETDIPSPGAAYYTLTAGNVFQGPFSGKSVPSGTWGIQNDVPYSAYPSLTFGLTQNAVVNQQAVARKPLSAATVLATQFAQITPLPIIYVWLEAQFVSETIITRIVGKSTKITFAEGIDRVTLKYEPNLGMFVASSAAGRLLAGHPAVQLIAPEVS